MSWGMTGRKVNKNLLFQILLHFEIFTLHLRIFTAILHDRISNIFRIYIIYNFIVYINIEELNTI